MLMKKLCQLLNKAENELFEEIVASFQNKITFLENSDDLTVRIEPISNSVTQELKTLLASLSIYH